MDEQTLKLALEAKYKHDEWVFLHFASKAMLIFAILAVVFDFSVWTIILAASLIAMCWYTKKKAYQDCILTVVNRQS